MINYLARYATRAAVRRVVYVLVAVALAWCGIGRANAQTGPHGHDLGACTSNDYGANYCENASVALAQVTRLAQAQVDYYQSLGASVFSCSPVYWNVGGTSHAEDKQVRVEVKNTGTCGVPGGGVINADRRWHGDGTCDHGVDPATGLCYPSEDECLARNAEPGFINVGDTVRNFTGKCINGCMFEAVGPHTITGGVTNGTFEWTGTCAIPPGEPPTEPDTEQEAAEPEDQICTEVAPGLSQCVNKNDEVCYTATATDHLCWGTGETGEKTEGPTLQKRNAGPDAVPPASLNLASGDTLSPAGQTTTTTTTSVGPNGTVTNIVTTVTNYTTNAGTDAGPSNDGEPADGSEDEGDEGEGGGGGTCADAPWFTHDPALEMVITQTWATRCAVEWGNAVTVTGDISDCSQPYTVTGGSGNPPAGANPGTHADAEKLRALRKQLCPLDPGEIDPSEYLGDAGTNDGFVVDGEPQGADGLDFSGFGWPNTCPQIPPVTINGTTINFDTTVFCDWLKLGGQFVLICAALVSLRVLAGPGGK